MLDRGFMPAGRLLPELPLILSAHHDRRHHGPVVIVLPCWWRGDSGHSNVRELIAR